MPAVLQRSASTVHVFGQLRAPGTSALRRAVTTLLLHGERYIVLDLEAVTDFDAVGIGEIVSLSTMTSAAGGTLQITGALTPMRGLLDDAGMLRPPHASTQQKSPWAESVACSNER